MRALILACVFFITALPAWAEFTDAEKAEMQRLYWAYDDLNTAYWYLGSGVQGTTASNKSAISLAWNEMRWGAYWWRLATKDFLLTDTTVTRGQQIGRVLSAIDSAVIRLKNAQGHLQTAQNATTDPTRADDLRRAREIWLHNAINRLVAISRTEAYLDPRPLAYPQIVGPHGDYDGAVGTMLEALRFIEEFLGDHSRTVYSEGTGTVSNFYWAIFRVHLRTTAIAKKYGRALFNTAIIPLDASQCAFDRTMLVGNSLPPIVSHTSGSGGVDGAPYHFDQLLADALVPIRSSVSGSTLDNWLKRLTASWRFGDGWVRRVFEFPDPVKLEQARQVPCVECGQPSAGPPACP